MIDHIQKRKDEQKARKGLIVKGLFIALMVAAAMTLDYQYQVEANAQLQTFNDCYTDAECEGMEQPADTPDDELDCDDNVCTPDQEERFQNLMDKGN